MRKLILIFMCISTNLFAQSFDTVYHREPSVYRIGLNLNIFRDVDGSSTFYGDDYSDIENFLSSNLSNGIYLSYINVPIFYNNSTEFSLNAGMTFISVDIKFYPFFNDATGFFIGPNLDIYFVDDYFITFGFNAGYTLMFSNFFLMFELNPDVGFPTSTHITGTIDLNICFGYQIKEEY